MSAEDSPLAREWRADELARAGELEAALDEYLWCFDHGVQIDPAYTGVRSSFLLSAIARLGERLPRALAELRSRRDATLQHLYANPLDLSAASDVSALDHYLGEDEHALRVFDELRSRNRLSQRVGARFGYHLMELFLERRRYSDILATLNEPSVPHVHELLARSREDARDDANSRSKWRARAEEAMREATRESDDPATKELIRNLFEAAVVPDEESSTRRAVRRVAHIYEAELGAGSPERADAIAAAVLDDWPTTPTFVVLILIQRALRTGHVHRARSLAERALNTLPTDQHAKVQAALDAGASWSSRDRREVRARQRGWRHSRRSHSHRREKREDEHGSSGADAKSWLGSATCSSSRLHSLFNRRLRQRPSPYRARA